jgi:hypothetical protein
MTTPDEGSRSPRIGLTVTLKPGTSPAWIDLLTDAIRGQPEVEDVTADGASALTVTVKPGTSPAMMVELMLLIRGRAGVADVKWDVETWRLPNKKDAPAEWVLCDQVMWLLGHLAPI